MKKHTPSLVEGNTDLKYQRRKFLNMGLKTMATSSLIINDSAAEDSSPPDEAVIIPEFITEASEYYELIPSYNDNICLSVAYHNNQDNKVYLNLQKIRKLEHQQWKVTYLGQKKFALSLRQMPDRVLDLNVFNVSNGEDIILINKALTINQLWYFFQHEDGLVSIRTAMNYYYCCDVFFHKDLDNQLTGGQIKLCYFNNGENQKWRIRKVV